NAARAAANLGDAHDWRGREAQHKVAPKAQHLWSFSCLGYVEMCDEKSGFADWNTTTFTDGFASRSVISAPNSTIVVGRNMLIGGLLKGIVHQPGWVRSALNCAFACSLPRCVALDWVIHLLLSCEEPYRSDRKPARTSSEKSFGCS